MTLSKMFVESGKRVKMYKQSNKGFYNPALKVVNLYDVYNSETKELLTSGKLGMRLVYNLYSRQLDLYFTNEQIIDSERIGFFVGLQLKGKDQLRVYIDGQDLGLVDMEHYI